MSNCKGATLVDVVLALVLLSMSCLLYSAAFPSGFSSIRRGGEVKFAVAQAEQKLESVKSLGYESLTYANLKQNVIDVSPASSPYSFTELNKLKDTLGSSSSSTLTINDEATGLKRITVTINWKSGDKPHSITMRTLLADKRPWGGS